MAYDGQLEWLGCGVFGRHSNQAAEGMDMNEAEFRQELTDTANQGQPVAICESKKWRLVLVLCEANANFTRRSMNQIKCRTQGYV